jgi:hypothetical protein
MPTRNVWEVRIVQKSITTRFHAGILLGLIDPEDGGETSVDFQRTTRRYIPEDSTLQWQLVEE